jgi:hypothetical protein
MVVPWKDVFSGGKTLSLFIWLGGIPTSDDIHKAPPFTLFPSPNKATAPEGLLPTGEELDDVDEMMWFVSDRDTLSYDDEVVQVLKDAKLIDEDPLYSTVETNDELRGDKVRFRGREVVVGNDDQAWPWAIERGYTLFKVPDAVGSPHYIPYVVDDYVENGGTFGWYQTPQRAEWLRVKPIAGSVAAELALINRHRRRIGQKPLDPVAAGWSHDDILTEARFLRSQGFINPVDEIKARMLAW